MNIEKVNGFLNSYAALDELNLPFQASYAIEKIKEKCLESYKFYQTKLTMILEQYGEHDENGKLIFAEDKMIKLTDEGIKQFNELQEVEYDECNIKIPYKSFENVVLSPKLLSGLMYFIE